MAMNRTEVAAIRNVIARLKEANCGCSPDTIFNNTTREIVRLAETLREPHTLEIVSRIYLDTWIIPALELLLPGEGRDPELARELAAK